MMRHTLYKRVLAAALLVSLAACSRDPKPTLNPAGTWEGTLTTREGEVGVQTFTAVIRASETAEDPSYRGAFVVGDDVYEVTGYFYGRNDEGEIFIFESPFEEGGSAASPTVFYGARWSGTMTQTRYTGGWFFNSETSPYAPAGTFRLERSQ